MSPKENLLLTHRRPTTGWRLLKDTTSFVTYKMMPHLGAEAALEHVANPEYAARLSQYTEITGIVDQLPNLDLILSAQNVGEAFTAIHLVAGLIDFSNVTTNKHPNKFVRIVAKINRALTHENDQDGWYKDKAKSIAQGSWRGIGLPSVHSLPDNLPLTMNAMKDLLVDKEHPMLSGLFAFLTMAGSLHLINDVAKITAKIIEKWDARYSNHEANVQKSRTRTETVERDPEIVQLGRKHRQNLNKEVKKVQDHVTDFAEGEGVARANEAAAADPGGYAMQQRLKEHQAMLERKYQNRILLTQILPNTKLNAQPKPLPESLLRSISREAERRFRKMMDIGKFFRDQSAKNPQEEKPIVLREVDHRKK